MNQILYAEEEKKHSSIDIKKIIPFFAIAIAMLGIVLLVIAICSIKRNKSNVKVVVPEEIKDNVNIELAEIEDKKVMIKIESEIAISHIIYVWNSETPQTLDETGKTSIEEVIDIPVGENALEVTVIDTNGKETKSNGSYKKESIGPVIEEGSIAGNYYKISITSENELAYVTYKWNSENEVKDDMYTHENKNSFEKKIEVPQGLNTLKIEAEDVLGNKASVSKEIEGVQKPVTKVTAQNGYLHFVVTGVDNIQTVEFEINGKKYIMNANTFGETKEVTYNIKMQSGWNYLKITATTVRNAVDTSYWKYEF